jgi:hypothetical protein
MRTNPDIGLQITGFLMGGCLYMKVGGLEIPAIARSNLICLYYSPWG